MGCCTSKSGRHEKSTHKSKSVCEKSQDVYSNSQVPPKSIGSLRRHSSLLMTTTVDTTINGNENEPSPTSSEDSTTPKDAAAPPSSSTAEQQEIIVGGKDDNDNVRAHFGEDGYNPDKDLITHDDLTWVHHTPAPPPPDTHPPFVTAAVEELHKKLIVDVLMTLINEGLFFTSKEGKQSPPFQIKSPAELKTAMDFTLGGTGVQNEALIDIVKGVTGYQPHTGHPFYMEQRVAGMEPYSSVSNLIASSVNCSNTQGIVGTMLTLLEIEVVRSVCQLVYGPRGANGDGVVTSGTCLANMSAMRMAGEQKLQLTKRRGLSGSPCPVFFVNKECTTVYSKAAVCLGYGTDSVVGVAVDKTGKMDMHDLRTKIYTSQEAGSAPCMVVGCAGTRILRAVDPLDTIADICQELHLWFHVDGTWGGGLLFSDSLKKKLVGAERSDSFTWSLQLCGVGVSGIVVPHRHKERMSGQYLGVGEGLSYGFMKTPLYNAKYDLGRNRLGGSSTPDVVKLWGMWRAKGVNGLGKHMDYVFGNAQYCLQEMNKREGFYPVLEEFEGTNVCFYYVPTMYRGIVQYSEIWREKVSKLTLAIRQTLLVEGVACLSYNEMSNKPTFIVIGLHNSAVTPEDILYILWRIEQTGEALGNPDHPYHKQNAC